MKKPDALALAAFEAARKEAACVRSEDEVVAHAADALRLTAAQARTLAAILRGASNLEIASALSIAERTVEAHVTAILAKAGVASRSALIASVHAAATSKMHERRAAVASPRRRRSHPRRER